MKFSSSHQPSKRRSRKGIPNKTTKEIKQLFQNLLSDNLERMQEDLDSLDAKTRVKCLIDLTKYVLPTLRSTEIKEDANKPTWINNLMTYTEKEIEAAINGN